MSKHIPLEKTITNNILKYLNGMDGEIRARKIPGGPYGGGWPDILCVVEGHAVFFEVKRPKVGKLTDLQRDEMRKWQDAGAWCYVVKSVDDVQETPFELSRYALQTISP